MVHNNVICLIDRKGDSTCSSGLSFTALGNSILLPLVVHYIGLVHVRFPTLKWELVIQYFIGMHGLQDSVLGPLSFTLYTLEIMYPGQEVIPATFSDARNCI